MELICNTLAMSRWKKQRTLRWGDDIIYTGSLKLVVPRELLQSSDVDPGDPPPPGTASSAAVSASSPRVG